MEREIKILSNFVKSKGLNDSKQRHLILTEFVNAEKHLSAEELYLLVKQKDSSVGIATVFRALKLFVDAGLAEPVRFSDKTVKYEYKLNRQHHDHIICEKCGKIIEFADPKIEELQEVVCQKYGFIIKNHRLDIFGICKKCKKGGQM